MESIKLSGTLRTDIGKRSSTLLRREEQVPCVIYGGEGNIHFSAPYKSFKKLIFTTQFLKAEIEIAGKTYFALAKDVQTHPVTDEITHVDFLELVPGKKVVVDVPVALSGFAKGVQAGGKIEQGLKKVKVKTTVENLIDKISVDISHLDLGNSLKVKEIQLANAEIMTAGNIPVAKVIIPRALRNQQAEEAKAAKK